MWPYTRFRSPEGEHQKEDIIRKTKSNERRDNSMNLKETRNTEYSKCVNLLAKLIDLDDNTKEKSSNAFSAWG